MNITIILVIVTVAASFYAWSKPEIMYQWIMNPYKVWNRREWHRMLLSGFIHNDQMHLLFNMFTLYFLGRGVETIFYSIFGQTMGAVYYLALYLLGIIFSDLPTLFKYRFSEYYNALGASGGVSAVVFAFILILPLQELCVWGVLCLPGIIWGILYVIYSVYSRKQGNDGINHDAHLFGALFGVIFCILLDPRFIANFFQQLQNIFH